LYYVIPRDIVNENRLHLSRRNRCRAYQVSTGDLIRWRYKTGSQRIQFPLDESSTHTIASQLRIDLVSSDVDLRGDATHRPQTWPIVDGVGTEDDTTSRLSDPLLVERFR